MEDIDILAQRAETEVKQAKRLCEFEAYDATSRNGYWDVIRKWIDHPQFDKNFNALENFILNELPSTLSNVNLWDEGWILISELAKRWHQEGNETMKESLRIAIFEVVAEPPEYPPTLELLFSLATDAETRWAVFSAYEKFPWRLRPHAWKYSAGSVTDDDCDQWLTSQGLYEDEILMTRTRNDIDALKIFIETKTNKSWNTISDKPS